MKILNLNSKTLKYNARIYDTHNFYKIVTCVILNLAQESRYMVKKQLLFF